MTADDRDLRLAARRGAGGAGPAPHPDAALAPAETACRDTPFRIYEPQRLLTGVVFSSPHSGRAYFSDFIDGSALSLSALRASEDAFVDELFLSGVSLGAPMIAAVAPRAFLDLNRRATELDPLLVDGAAAQPHSTRVAAGLGVVPRIVAEGVAIYDRRLSAEEAETRIAHWHAPYHRALAKLLARARRRFGAALLIDCHSMPSNARLRARSGEKADIVLGDRYGAAAAPIYVEAVEAAFRAAGFSVARNTPFAGGHITERFGRPAAGVSAIQIEIDRALYLDEHAVTRSDAFYDVVEALRPVASSICALLAEPGALAAE